MISVKTISRERGTERLETFSDGVFAFAITLLVLGLYDPTTRGSSLFQGLLAEWPTFSASATSFMTILILWMNHQNMFNYITRVSKGFMLLNGLLLLFVVVTPFTTLLVSEHLLFSDATVAAAAYAGSFFLLSVTWNILWHNASHHHDLVREDIPQNQIRHVTREYALGPLFYALAFFVAFVSPVATAVLVILIAVYYGITATGSE